MSKLLFWLLVAPVAVIAGFLAVANRAVVTFSFDPLPFAVDLPLYVLVLVSAFLGLVAGAGAMWWRDGKVRRLARQRRRDRDRLAHEVREMKQGHEPPTPGAVVPTPADRAA